MAEDTASGCQVVLKSCAASTELRREVAAYQQLGRHPLLAPLLPLFEEGGRLHLVLPYYAKGDMRGWFSAVKVGPGMKSCKPATAAICAPSLPLCLWRTLTTGTHPPSLL